MLRPWQNWTAALSARILPWALIATSLSVLRWVLAFSRYGLDFTDEGYYLNSVSVPYLYAFSIPVTLFGFVLHPSFELLGGDIGLFRQAGMIMTFVLAWVLAYATLSSFWARGQRDHLTLASISAAAATLSLAYYSSWLPTPSYNLLNFHALMIVALGVVLARREPTASSVTGWVLIGVGGWLAFTSKPSSAAAIAILVPLCLIAAGSFRFTLAALAGCISAALLLGTAVLIDGSPAATVQRLGNSVEMQYLLGSGQEVGRIFRVDDLRYGYREWFIVMASAVLVYLTIRLEPSRPRYMNLLRAICGLLIGLGVAFGLGFSRLFNNGFNGTILFGLALALAAAALARIDWRKPYTIGRAPAAVGLLLLLMPHVYIFGSNSQYWLRASEAGFFWVLAGLVAWAAISHVGVSPGALVPVGLVFPLLSVALVDKGFQHPYRQPPDLYANNTAYSLVKGGRVVLTADTAAYLSAAARAAEEFGLHQGMNVIDLTGQSGGLLYALGLNSLGQPWMVGGYPGSDAVARAVLVQLPCSVSAGAWILDEPGGLRAISPSVLARIGANRGVDYQLVGSFPVAKYAGGSSPDARRVQNLLRPTRSATAATAACLASRSVAQDHASAGTGS